MSNRLTRGAALVAVMVSYCALTALAQAAGLPYPALKKVVPTKPPYSPWAGRSHPLGPFWGDTHDVRLIVG
jgi:hypothetical protein